jgi:hypothetical protein
MPRRAPRSDPPSRVDLVDSFEKGIELVERGTSVDHFCLQKYSIVGLTHENRFDVEADNDQFLTPYFGSLGVRETDSPRHRFRTDKQNRGT